MAEDHILIADDDPDVLAALRLLLENSDFRVTAATSPRAVLNAVETHDLDLLIMDLNYSLDTTSGVEGMELIPKLRQLDETLPLVVMTGWGSIDVAVRTMQLGAADFVQKPWDNERLLATVASLIRLRHSERMSRKLSAENDLLRSELEASDGGLIAESAQMQRVLELIDRVADSGVSMLLTGENGTGKSLLARHIHRRSKRHDQSFISINMGSISEGLFESEMFGHIRGAFTDAKENRIGRFELADGGTLFLDEIANTLLAQQAKLLRVLEEKQFEKVGSSRTQSVDVRLICASNMDLNQAVATGRLRTDLLYRINTLEIELPALRDRSEDIIPLAELFFGQMRARYQSDSPGLSTAAKKLLTTYRWPGNVRELQHVIERAMLLCGDQAADIPHLVLPAGIEEVSRSGTGGSGLCSLQDIENETIRQRLAYFEGNALEAAKSLGLSRSAFYRRLEKYGI